MSLKVDVANARSFTELKSIVDHVRIGLSFFGEPYIDAPGRSGTLPLDTLTARVIEMVNQCQFKFNRKERASGKSIASRISDCYSLKDILIDRSCFFTRLFVFLRSLPDNISGIIHLDGHMDSLNQWYWNNNNDSSTSYFSVFNYYTRNQCLLYFWKIPEKTDQFSHPEYNKRGQRPPDCYFAIK